MTLDEILEMWKKDVVIDDVCLDEATMATAKLHAKYLELFSTAKLQLKRKEMEMDTLRKDKWMWFNGKLTKADMDGRGWRYDPFDGMVRPLKGDMDMFYATDPDISKLAAIIEYNKIKLSTLEEIMNNIRWRHSHIRNVLDFKKFVSGI